MNCEGCGLAKEQSRLSEARAREAIAEAYKYRRLWEASASCLAHNAKRVKARGEDEAKLLEMAKEADSGVFWSGTTKGWLT